MTLSAGLAAKIIEIAKELPSLKKEDNNGSFNYVSIDAYYERVAKACLEAGLSWIPTETDCEFKVDDDFGLIQTQQYAFTLFTADGDVADEVIRFTITHPYQDAQTTGSSLSYAEKLLMRVLFKVVTGEGDADSKAPRKRQQKREDVESPFKGEEREPEKPKAKPGPKPKGKPAPEPDPEDDKTATAKAIKEIEDDSNDDDGNPPWDEQPNLHEKTANELIAAIKKCKNAADLDQFRLDQAEGIAWLKAEGAKDEGAAKQRDRVADLFRKKFEEYNSGDE